MAEELLYAIGLQDFGVASALYSQTPPILLEHIFPYGRPPRKYLECVFYSIVIMIYLLERAAEFRWRLRGPIGYK